MFNLKVNRWRKRSFVSKWQITEVLVVVLISTLVQYPLEISRSVVAPRGWQRRCAGGGSTRVCSHRAVADPGGGEGVDADAIRVPSGHLMGALFAPCGSTHDTLGLCKCVAPWRLTARAQIPAHPDQATGAHGGACCVLGASHGTTAVPTTLGQ